MADDSSGKGRRGKKKGRGRQQEHNALGSSGGRVAVDKQQQRNKSTRLGNGVSADQAPFPVVLDSRFSSMHSAPAFQRVKPDERKVQLDDRFKAVLTDPRFQVSTAKVDKYGRKVSKSSKQATKQLRAFYKLEGDGRKGGQTEGGESDPEEENSQEEEEKGEGVKAGDGNAVGGAGSGNDVGGHDNKEQEQGSSTSSIEEGGDDDDQEEDDDGGSSGGDIGGGGGGGKPAESRQDYLTRLSRGEISELSSSDDDDDDDSSDDDGSGAQVDGDSDGGGRTTLDHPSQEEVPLTEESTRRLAVTNCDWDHMRARDLLVLCGSFCPASARLLSVTVYPSDFGEEMMKVEAAAGPHAALAAKNYKKRSSGETGDDDDDDDDDDSKSSEGEDEVAEGATVAKAGIAMAGSVLKRRRPGIIIEEYRTNGSDNDEKGAKLGASGNGEAGEKKGTESNGDSNANNAAGFDPEKLRVYELAKLKYYFAVLECDTTATAETIYREVDGMEFEHSSVALDLRSIPDDISFEGRRVRDRASSVPSSYQPPSFICKALQQTRVECTWDEVSTDRKALLSRVSQWRDAAEEDFEAYLASSAEESSDDDDDDDDDEKQEQEDPEIDPRNGLGDDKEGEERRNPDGIKEKRAKGVGANKKMSSKAQRARRLLLAGALGSSASEREESNDGEDSEDHEEFSYVPKASGSREGVEDDMVVSDSEFTFVPRGERGDGAEGLLARKREKEALAKETPWEASLRKERERKKARKKAIKEKVQAAEEDRKMEDDFFLEEGGPEDNNQDHHRRHQDDEDGGAERGRLSALGTGAEAPGLEDEEDRRDYDMHRLAREEKLKGKKLRGKRRRKEEAREKAPGQDFRVDVADERFAAVLEGDTRFGIDRTDAGFKDTEGMRQILEERSKRTKDRQQQQQQSSSNKNSSNISSSSRNKLSSTVAATTGSVSSNRSSGSDLSSLVTKLKTRGLAATTNNGRIGGGKEGEAKQGRRGKKKRRRG